jgi:Animal haem peroxidase
MEGEHEHRDRLDLAAERASRHGIAVPRDQDEVAESRDQRESPDSRRGRFGRMFDDPNLRPDPGDEAIEQLARKMIDGSGNSKFNEAIPAGYTYLGQFIDHDVTFDTTPQLRRDTDPRTLVNVRTPRLDLDSLYGSGPMDQPFLYDWGDSAPFPGVKLLVGENPPEDEVTKAALAKVDLPRNQQGRALVGDARNDENLIISQLHLLFIHFHNKVVDQLATGAEHFERTELLEEAQRIVRWHYQWIVTHDFLPRIVGKKMADSVLQPSDGDAAPTVKRKFFKWADEPFMPVEFSAAAFRFGHSMVRDTYRVNDTAGVPIFLQGNESGRHLGGLRRLPDSLRIEWDQFFPTSSPMTAATANSRMDSMRIDERLAPRLRQVPPDRKALARLNLRRGHRLGLPAGPLVADAMGEARLSEKDLHLDGIDATTRGVLVHATPLWYYVLREAAHLGDGGQRLGLVGGRIVAEVLAGLLEGDPSSYLHAEKPWKPDLGETEGSFTIRDLIRFALRDD